MEISLDEMKAAVAPLVGEDPLGADIHSPNVLRQWLRDRIAVLIDEDFAGLLSLLYRIDVEEERIRALISENQGQDAAAIIADLILTRQAEKIRSRRRFQPGEDGRYFH